MFLSEYQAKEILQQYGIPVPAARVAASPEEAETRAREMEARKYVVKAQIRAGGRGLAGGVKFAATPSAVATAAAGLIGTRLVTEQTGPAGEMVEKVLVEASVEIERSVYLALVISQETARPTLLMSAQGGEAFEEKVRRDEGIVESLTLGPRGEIPDGGLEGLFRSAGLAGEQDAELERVVAGLIEVFFANDVSLLEINPLAVSRQGRVVALDAKMVIDDNALQRHPELAELADTGSTTPAERLARDNEINFVKLDGNIGVVVNGAGLGLATNDMIIDAGGRPANFMDIRTTATSFQIANGVSLLLRDPEVKTILVNIHGGGMTVCDTIAEGINFAYSRSDRKPPIVYRAAGQNARWSEKIMKDRALPFEPSGTMTAAVRRAVDLAGGR